MKLPDHHKRTITKVVLIKLLILSGICAALYLPTHYALIVNLVANGVWMFKL